MTTKWLDKFLEFKNEADATRKFALAAVVVITLGLASLSVTGIIATATWKKHYCVTASRSNAVATKQSSWIVSMQSSAP